MSVLLYGAGSIGRRTALGLRRLRQEPLAFIDRNEALWGTMIEDMPVLSIDQALKAFGRDMLVTVTVWRGDEPMADRMVNLRRRGFRRVQDFLCLYRKHPGVFLPHYCLDTPPGADIPLFSTASTVWADGRSHREYFCQSAFRLYGWFDALPDPIPSPQYFPEGLFRLGPDEVFVDCGAYNGDTLADLLWSSAHRPKAVIAFEPDRKSASDWHGRYGKVKGFEIWPLAVGNHNGMVNFSADGTPTSSVIPDGTDRAMCIKLDDHRWDEAPTFIKMDIEGCELGALEGAREIIRKHAPILAIACYHKQSHLWEIPLKILEIRDDYLMYLRPHQYDGWDLVCYAVPKHRAIAEGRNV